MASQAFYMLVCHNDEITLAFQEIQRLRFATGMLHFVAQIEGPWDIAVHAEANSRDILVGPIHAALLNTRGVREVNTFFVGKIAYLD